MRGVPYLSRNINENLISLRISKCKSANLVSAEVQTVYGITESEAETSIIIIMYMFYMRSFNRLAQ